MLMFNVQSVGAFIIILGGSAWWTVMWIDIWEMCVYVCVCDLGMVNDTYLEVQNDCPYQTQNDWWSPIHQISWIDINQLYTFAGQELQSRVSIAEEMWTSQNTPLLHG